MNWHTTTFESNDATIQITNGIVNIWQADKTDVPPIEIDEEDFLYVAELIKRQGKE